MTRAHFAAYATLLLFAVVVLLFVIGHALAACLLIIAGSVAADAIRYADRKWGAS